MVEQYDQTNENQQQQQQQSPPPAEGSWLPFSFLILIILIRWIITSQSSFAIRIRRWCNTQKLIIRQQLGLRDDSVYNTHAGQGATKSNKRQG